MFLVSQHKFISSSLSALFCRLQFVSPSLAALVWRPQFDGLNLTALVYGPGFLPYLVSPQFVCPSLYALLFRLYFLGPSFSTLVFYQVCWPLYCWPQYCRPQYCRLQYCRPRFVDPCLGPILSALVCQPLWVRQELKLSKRITGSDQNCLMKNACFGNILYRESHRCPPLLQSCKTGFV